jgi:hypothetical protein
MLNLITKLLEKDRLFMAHLPLPPDEAASVRRMSPDAVAKLVDPEVFEFTWENSGIFVDADELTHYPKVSEKEVQDAVQCPVPHDKIVIHTQVTREGFNNPASYIWHVEATENGYIATPFVFADQTLSYFGTTLIFDRRYTNPDGSPAFGCRTPASHPVIYDKEELLEHHCMLLRFLRILCLPQAVIEEIEPTAQQNRARARRGRPPLPRRRIVRIAPEAIQRIALPAENEGIPEPNAVENARAPVVAHHRRAHLRRLSSGRLVRIRSCIVNDRGHGALPPPQDFHVDGPRH